MSAATLPGARTPSTGARGAGRIAAIVGGALSALIATARMLAIPHYAVLASLLGWWNVTWTLGELRLQPPGVLGVLVAVAAVVLLVRGRHSRDVFALVVGVNRWALRVAAYAGLMRDEYPHSASTAEGDRHVRPHRRRL